MVKRLFKFILYAIFFVFALILFSPKASLYFLLENNLKKFDIVISDEVLEDKAFTLHIQNLNINAKGVDSATIKEADIELLLFVNSIELHNIELSSLVDSFLPAKIKSVKLSYTLFNPVMVYANGNGKFGNAEVEVNLLKRELKIFLKPSKKMLRNYQNSLRMFKKDANGEYIYAKTF